MYLRNGIKLGQTTIINDVVYDITWFGGASAAQLKALEVTYVTDPVYPDPNLYTYTTNVDGSLDITPIPPETVAATKAANDANEKANNIQILWQAAHDYEYAQISGTAIGILVLGVLQNKPKSLAIKDWSHSIWVLYYSRKALVTATADPTFQDFSSCGPIPYSIPELMVELGL
ncbi:MAG: hypothetical protein ACHP6H_03060 [Legionellales bacterium]